MDSGNMIDGGRRAVGSLKRTDLHLLYRGLQRLDLRPLLSAGRLVCAPLCCPLRRPPLLADRRPLLRAPALNRSLLRDRPGRDLLSLLTDLGEELVLLCLEPLDTALLLLVPRVGVEG